MAAELQKSLELNLKANVGELRATLQQVKTLLKEVNGAASQQVKTDVLSNIEAQSKQSLAPIGELKAAFQGLVAEIKKSSQIKTEIIKPKSVADATANLRVLKSEMVQAARASETLTSKLQGAASVLQAAALPLAGFSAGLTLLLGKAGSDFGQFEKSLKTIEAVASATQAEINAIKAASFELGQQTVFSNQQVVDAFLELSRAGFTARESLAAMPKLLELAAAAGGDLATASAIVGQNLKAFGLQVDDTGRLVDVIAQAANRSAASIEDMGFAFKQVAPLAAQTGQSIEDVSALLAILANNGVKGADAGSDLRNVLSRLLNPSKEVATAMNKLGVSLKNQDGTVKPLLKLFEEMNGKFAKLSASSRAQAAAMIAGEENLKSFLILTGTAPAEIDKMVFSMEHATGAAQLMANTIQQGLANSLEQFKGSAETLSTQLGESLAPAFSLVLKNATALINVLIQNRGITSFAAGAGLAAAALLSLTTAAAGAVAIFGPLVTALGAAGVTMASLTPIGLAAAAVIAGAGGLTVAMAEAAQTAETAGRSINTLKAEVNATSDSVVKATRDSDKLGKEYDDLGKKVKRTTEEETRRKEIIDILALKMPGQIDKVLELSKKYGSLAQAIREVNIESTALKIGENIQKELDKVDSAIRNIQGGFTGARDARGAKILDPEETKRINNLQAQQTALLQKQKNIKSDLINLFKLQDKELEKQNKKAQESIKGTVVDFKTPKANTGASQIASARESLTKLQETLEVELTALTEGEFAKRRAAAKKTYDYQLRQADRLGKTAKASVLEIAQTKADALNLFNQTLSDISIKERNYLIARQAAIRAVGDETTVLKAKLTQANPFDDIEASALRAAHAINDEFAKAVIDAQTSFKEDKNRGIYDSAIAAAKDAKTVKLSILRQETAQQRLEAVRAQQDINNKILELEAKLSGSRIDIAKATNQTIIDDLVLRRNAASKQFGENAAQAKELSLQLDAAIVQSNKEVAQAQIANQQDLIAGIERDIELQGNKRELLEQHRQAVEALITLYEQELLITGRTQEERAQILANIQAARKELAVDNTKLSAFGSIVSGLSTIQLPTGQYSQFFKTLVGGLQQASEMWGKFKAQQSGGGFLDFLKTSNFKQLGVQVGAQALAGVIQATKGQKSAIGQTVGSIGGAIIGGYLGGPAGAQAGAAVGGALGSLFKKQSGLDNPGTIDKILASIPSLSGLAAFRQGGFKQALKQSAISIISPIAGIIYGFKFLKKLKSDLNKVKAANKSFQTQFNGIVGATFEDGNLTQLNTAQSKLEDLTTQLNTLYAKNKFKTDRGKDEAKKARKKAAAAIASAKKQIAEAQAEIQKAIEERDRFLAQDNAILTAQLSQAPTDEISATAIRNLVEIERTRDEAIRKGVATNVYLENIELQRKNIMLQSSEDILAAVIDEQSRIRQLRAQQAVDEANAAGNQLAIINAELQQKLVALDDEIAAFRGIEEEKTAFLAQKSAERKNIVKASQDQINELLQSGLDILNEGLVVSQTKAEGQTKRLQKLFGTLNPLGLIQSGGNLLQTNVTIGAGAFQFAINGVQDVTAFMNQLSTDPILQGRLQAVINTIFARQ